MADFDSIKISHLTPTEIIQKDDLLVVDRLQIDTQYLTNRVTVGKLIDYITITDLNFTGNVTFVGSIKPPPDFTLDGIFDNVTIRGSITLNEGVKVNGIYIDDLEDVVIDLPEVGQTLLYQKNPITGELYFKNDFFPNKYVPDAPVDGQIYARKDGQWKDITECIRCPEDVNLTLGSIILTKDSPGDIFVNIPTAFTAVSFGNVYDQVYSWRVTPDSVIIADTQSKSILFEFGSFIETIVGTIKQVVSTDPTYQISVNTDGVIQILNNSNEIDLQINSPSTQYSWSIAQNHTSILLDDNKSINLNNFITRILNSIFSFTDVFDSPRQGTYKLNISDTKEISISKISSNGVSVNIPIISEPFTDSYDWKVMPTTTVMSNPRSSTQFITFQQPINYAVTCTVSSSTALDSPKVGGYDAYVMDTFRILSEVDGRTIATENGNLINHENLNRV